MKGIGMTTEPTTTATSSQDIELFPPFDVRLMVAEAVADLHRTALSVARDITGVTEELRVARSQQSAASRFYAIERLKAKERGLL